MSPGLGRLLEPDAIVPPPTTTGVVAAAAPPSPSWPPELAPQHFTAPLAVRAQVWEPPATTVPASPRDATSTGTLEFAVAPFPSCPELLMPQHFTVPPERPAQEVTLVLDAFDLAELELIGHAKSHLRARMNGRSIDREGEAPAEPLAPRIG